MFKTWTDLSVVKNCLKMVKKDLFWRPLLEGYLCLPHENNDFVSSSPIEIRHLMSIPAFHQESTNLELCNSQELPGKHTYMDVCLL